MTTQVATLLSRICRSSHPACRIRNNSLDAGQLVTGLARLGSWLLLLGLLVGLVTAQPVAAQAANPVCSGDSGTLPKMIEGFLQLTTSLGLMGLLVVWQADELAQMFTMKREQTRALKQHKYKAVKSAAVLVLLGPLFTIAGRLMELPVAQCVNLVPF